MNAEVAAAFDWRCAYLAVCIEASGEVDHFVSCNEDPALAYEWTNYRYCDPRINKLKRHARAGDLLDPFEIEDDWFELSWPDLQLRVTDRCPPALRERADRTLRTLKLRDGEQALRTRRAWVERFEAGAASLALLDEMAPMVARMLRRRGHAST